MSRVGNSPITVPSGVEVAVEGRTVVVTGARGTLSRDLPGEISLRAVDGTLHVERPDDTARSKSLHGLARSLVQNMVTGVSGGFERRLQLVGIGYRAQMQGSRLSLSLGFSHPVELDAPEGISIQTPSQTEIVISGIDKQRVGQTAAEIRAFRPPEPYKGKGIKYRDEIIVRKEGKKK